MDIFLNFIFFFTAGLELRALWMPGKCFTSELHLQLCLLDSEFGSFLSRLVMCNPVLALDVRQIQKAALQGLYHWEQRSSTLQGAELLSWVRGS